MAKISCNATNCSYNNSRSCYAGNISIGGLGATENRSTCCGTFLNSDVYSSLSNSTQYKKDVVSIGCSVATCKYNENQKCSLDSIDVNGSKNTSFYTETECGSFELS